MKLLLHTCCAPCSISVVEQLQDQYEITAYFYDPNIHPEKEYLLRLKEIEEWCQKINLPLIEAPYELDKWFKLTKGLENEPEKGKRCTVCYDMRMEHAAVFAKKNGFDIFTTVLSISPHKDAERINQIGQELAKKHSIRYLEGNWKKKGGFQRSIELSKEYDLFRQHYCGCVYSLRDSILRRREK